MRIDLTDDETRTLRTMLQDYLPRLRREIARTDSHDYRHDLIPQLDLCERLLGMLEEAPR
jgi:hypothetical protein